jgi:thioredoxin 1
MTETSPESNQPMAVTDDTFIPEVLNSDLPAVVDFWSPQCPPCKGMTELVNSLAPEYAGRINFYTLNVDENPTAVEKLKIHSVPTLYFFKGPRVVDMVVGTASHAIVKEKLDKIAAGY